MRKRRNDLEELELESLHDLKILNCTPHIVRFYVDSVYDKKARKWIGGTLSMEIPKSKQMLSAHYKKDVPTLVSSKYPINRREIDYVDTPPEGYDYYIVSHQYLSSSRSLGNDVSKLVTPGESVYNESFKIIGCRKLILMKEYKN